METSIGTEGSWRRRLCLLAALGLAFAPMAACTSDAGSDLEAPESSVTESASTAVPSPIASPTTSPAAALSPLLPFVDEFDDDRNGWGGPYQSFVDGQFVWTMPPGQSDTRAPDTLIAVEGELDRVELETTFTASGVLAVGFECAYAERSGSSEFYNLELATDGAVIRKRPLGTGPVEVLATNKEVMLTNEPTVLAARCALVDGTYELSLSVDGQPAVEVVDAEPFGPGAPGLVVRADAESGDHVVRFDRFDVQAG